MKEDIKNEWVKRLRSGDYEQAQSALFNPENNAYCCLGVLCEIAREEGVVTKEDNYYVWTDNGDEMIEFHELPSSVMEWAGISTHGVELPASFWKSISMHIISLVDLNDEFGYDFNGIAAVIDTYWKDL